MLNQSHRQLTPVSGVASSSREAATAGVCGHFEGRADLGSKDHVINSEVTSVRSAPRVPTAG